MILFLKHVMNTSKKRFIDTNILIHTLFDVDPEKQNACTGLFKRAAQGTVSLWTSEWVIAELVWFLTKQKIAWKDIKKIIGKILVTKGLEVHNKDTLLGVLSTCTQSSDFNDVLHIVLASKNGIVDGYSYDKGLDKVGRFKRLEP